MKYAAAAFAVLGMIGAGQAWGAPTDAAPDAASVPAQATQAAPVPPGSLLVLTESENGFNGTWTFDGNTGTGVWGGHYGRPGNVADLTLLHFDGHCIDVGRTDTTGTATGLTATYHSCSIAGRHITGDASWTWPGHFTNSKGHWIADFDIVSPDEAKQRGEAALAGPDKAAARRWFALAAAHGSVPATYPLGVMMLDGVGGAKDIAGARRMFALGVQGGRGDSAYQLGRMTELGEGGPVDVEAARALYETSLKRRFVPALTRLVQFQAMEHVPAGLAPAPAWSLDDTLLRDQSTTLHTLATEIVDGPRRFVLAASCETEGISAASGMNLSLWLLSPEPEAQQLNVLKYRRQGTNANAGSPPLGLRFRPNRWTLMALPADTDETLGQYASQAQWQDAMSRLSFAFGMDGDFAIGMQGSSLTADQQAEAAHAMAAERMLRTYQIVFQQPPAGAGPDYADVLKVEVAYGPVSAEPDLLAQSRKVLAFNLNGMDASRHEFLVDKCQMADPYADPAVRREEADP